MKGICDFCKYEKWLYLCRVLNMAGVFHACSNCIRKLNLIPQEAINEDACKQEDEE